MKINLKRRRKFKNIKKLRKWRDSSKFLSNKEALESFWYLKYGKSQSLITGDSESISFTFWSGITYQSNDLYLARRSLYLITKDLILEDSI